MEIIKKVYLHSCTESMCEEFEDELSGEAYENIRGALYEVEFKLKVDTETGNYKILEVVDGRQILIPREG